MFLLLSLPMAALVAVSAATAYSLVALLSGPYVGLTCVLPKEALNIKNATKWWRQGC